MLFHLGAWQAWRGPVIAFAVALALAVAGRLLRQGLLAAAAGGAGVVAGWYVITGRLWVFPPTVSVAELTESAALSLLIGLLCTWLGPGHRSAIGLLVAALLAGWFLSGAPRQIPALRASWPIGLAVAAAALLLGRGLTAGSLQPLRAAAVALTLAASLHVAGAPPMWAQLALVPGLAAVAMLALPPMPALVALPLAVDIAALGGLASIAIGRLRHLGFAPVDAAALSPLLTHWLLPRMEDRLRFAGRIAPLIGALAAGAIAVGCVWLVRQSSV